MELIDQHTKKIMEGCKERARDAGLRFEDESLEYIVTNRDLLELSPKYMIPTLYDYWVHDVEVLREKGKYELYPHNPYETVINTRPAISFYNDNNPDWLNVMIFYHVLGHIDFFQNNLFFSHTWDYDFTGRALSDKRLIAKLRSEKGRWVDYVIEFSRGLDNLVGFFTELSRTDRPHKTRYTQRLDFYFDRFLQDIKQVKISEYLEEINRYNQVTSAHDNLGVQTFFTEVDKKYPEFEALFKKHLQEKPQRKTDIFQYLMDHSEFLNKEDNLWMKSVMEIVRKTSIFFQPQIRTKIMNEGWASYWHETLFMQDDRIRGHEVDFARINAGVTALPRVGLNPYALGLRLFYYIEDYVNRGKRSWDYLKLTDRYEREHYNQHTHEGRKFIFKVRESFCDDTFIDTFVDQDFVTQNNLFVAGRRLNEDRMVWEYYVQSRNAEDYKRMLLNSLYHPPFIEVDPEKGDEETLYLIHHFEGKPLVTEFIKNTMIGVEFLWGGPVQLETHEVASISDSDDDEEPQIQWEHVLYTMHDRRLGRRILK
ncbi:MAG: SpoVR family protein [Gemmatimonadetes bacterium]|nr:MAG: SpoVR family protein [Gemmatimonadota bacterium]